jgi:hypothetical protein
MKKIYDREQFFYIKGQTKEFQPTSIWRHLRVMDEDQVMAYERRYGYQSFQELWELVESGAVLNAEAQKTLFGNRQIYFKSGLDGFTVKEKRFTEVTIWWHCTECPRVSLKTLLENVPAEEMVEYFKDRGIEWGNK